MDKLEINFINLSWAAFMARSFGITGPDAYMNIYRDNKFRESLALDPSNVNPKEVCDKLIGGFLNKWRSRFPNNENSGMDILKSLESVKPFVKALTNTAIESIDFNKTIDINGEPISMSDMIILIFERIIHCHGYRTTAGAKILGVINPALFVMWDDSIAKHYASRRRDNIFNGVGYSLFLQKMQNAAQYCQTDFIMRHGHNDIAGYLSEKLEIAPRIPLAKYLDEYNWITITQRIQLPPKWHPECESA